MTAFIGCHIFDFVSFDVKRKNCDVCYACRWNVMLVSDL